ncbi:MAG: hypothetical protein M3N00_09490 [Actinomycetota bacterium]|nr:hypothetical protein [Actinomycetota bacterium]
MFSETAGGEVQPHGRYYAEYVWVTGDNPEVQLQEVLDAKEGMAPGRRCRRIAGRGRRPLLGHRETEFRQDFRVALPTPSPARDVLALRR